MLVMIMIIQVILRKLHNYIKTKLIVGVCSTFNEPIQILDMSIGRGGDLNRYLDKFLITKIYSWYRFISS